MENKEYWLGRALKREQKQFDDSKEYLVKLQQGYKQAITEINKQIERFYERYATDNQISLFEAKKALNSKELSQFIKELEAYKNQAEDQIDPVEYKRYLKNLSKKRQITRLDELESKIIYEIEKLYEKYDTGLDARLSDAYRSNYYTTLYDIQKGTGIGKSFTLLNDKAIKLSIHYDWSGKDFSDRIWKNKQQLLSELRETMTQGLIQGHSSFKMTKQMTQRLNVSYSNAFRLVRTETNFVLNASTQEAYIEGGIARYEYVATLDLRTSTICQLLDGKKYRVEDAVPGENYPPMHPNCRSTTIPVFDVKEIEQTRKRIAKGKGGNYFTVPASLKYPDWYKQNIT